MHLLGESIIVGLLTIIFGYIVGGLAMTIAPIPNLPADCMKWNENHHMEWSLFFTGFFLHMFLNLTQLIKIK